MEQFCPPPLNSSNLNDISSAIQALNISATNRETLGISGSQDMQDALVALKQLIESNTDNIQNIDEQINEINVNMVKSYTGMYAGNSQNSITIQTGDITKILVLYIISSSDSNSYASGYCVCNNNGVSGEVFVYYKRGQGYDPEVRTGQFTISGKTINFTGDGDYLNFNNSTYNYLVLGT